MLYAVNFKSNLCNIYDLNDENKIKSLLNIINNKKIEKTILYILLIIFF